MKIYEIYEHFLKMFPNMFAKTSEFVVNMCVKSKLRGKLSKIRAFLQFQLLCGVPNCSRRCMYTK